MLFGTNYLSWFFLTQPSTIFSTEGIRGLYAGMSVTFLGTTLAWSSYMYFYTHSKNFFISVLLHLSHLITSYFRETWNSLISILEFRLCYVRTLLLMKSRALTLAGWGTMLFTNPIWVVKTRLQLQTTRSAARYSSPLSTTLFLSSIFVTRCRCSKTNSQ